MSATLASAGTQRARGARALGEALLFLAPSLALFVIFVFVPLGRGVYRVKDLVEKPRREDAPSNLAIIGRYILTPDIFEALAATVSDRTGEIQLTNGLRRLLQKRPVYVCEIDGVRHDTGNKLGFLKALVYFALRRPELAEPFRRYLESLDLKIGVGR